jgi:hypothetical protein
VVPHNNRARITGMAGGAVQTLELTSHLNSYPRGEIRILPTQAETARARRIMSAVRAVMRMR